MLQNIRMAIAKEGLLQVLRQWNRMWRGAHFQPMPSYWALIPVSIDTAMKQKRKSTGFSANNPGQEQF